MPEIFDFRALLILKNFREIKKIKKFRDLWSLLFLVAVISYKLANAYHQYAYRYKIVAN